MIFPDTWNVMELFNICTHHLPSIFCGAEDFGFIHAGRERSTRRSDTPGLFIPAMVVIMGDNLVAARSEVLHFLQDKWK
ncbi:hypothetical protein GDO81_015074 [Engystomops pustulosus]|uniref:Uncharacterized protein n=1 Tax=Engystomops pustulosus TaxID=76066 RepID=A0AAV7AH20_ENGPU|nr:hypothetical protein GDO81_015074 [Engystomops pustulosus]